MKCLIPVLVSLTLGLAACSGAPTPTEITLDAIGMSYQPTMIEVNAGQPVKIVFRNNDTLDHDFSVMDIPVASVGATSEPMAGHGTGQMAEAPALHIAVMMGKSGVLEFTPTKPGTYEFFCTVAGHKDAGMVGTLVVK